MLYETLTGVNEDGVQESIILAMVPSKDPEDACDVVTTSSLWGEVERLGCETTSGARAYFKDRVKTLEREFADNARLTA